MCRPEHFTVKYAINPWMVGNENGPDVELAMAQWQALFDALAVKAEIVLVEPQPHLPDMVFTANAGVVYGGKAIASRFSPTERRLEEPHFRDWFSENGFQLLNNAPNDLAFEGAGDCLVGRGADFLWAAFGLRTDLQSHAIVQRYFDTEVVSLRLVDERFYHLDTCFCPLSDGFLMYYPPAFDSESCSEIEKRVPSQRRIPVDTVDALNFACNAVNIADRVFLHKSSAGLEASLSHAGFEVTAIDLSEFLKAGGSAKCLTLNLDEPVYS